MTVPSPRTLAAWTAAGAAGALLTVGALQAGAATTAPSADPGASSSATQDSVAEGATTEKSPGTAGHGRGGPRHALHGEFVTGTAETGFVTVVVQTGEVTAASATSLTVTSTDGFVETYALDVDTHVRVDGVDATATELAVGDTVRVSATETDGALSADRVGAGDEPTARGGPGGRGHHGGPGSAADAPTADTPAA